MQIEELFKNLIRPAFTLLEKPHNLIDFISIDG